MLFSDLSKKMLLANIKSFQIFICGNILAISLFFAFASVYTNTSFMDETIVDPMISSNILFAGVLVTLFFIVMILISGRVFWDARREEYAVMTVLGMRRKEAVFYLIRENLFVLAGAFPIALLLGTIISFCFYVVMRYVIGIAGICWMDNGKGYILTFILYGILSVVSITWNATSYVKENLVSKLKTFRPEKDGVFVHFLKRYFPKNWNRHLPQLVFIRLHRKMWCVRYGMGSLLICGMLFLIGICVSLFPSFKENADIYSPYDMLYTEMNGMNQASQHEITRILKQNDVEITENMQFEYVRNSAFNFISVTEINAIFKCGYEVRTGECINLFQIDETDGYEHDLTPVETVTLADDLQLTSIGSNIRILWNQNPTFADRTLIVSDEDYNRIKGINDCHTGKVNLYQFRDWKASASAILKVDAYLQQINGLDRKDQYYYRTSSHINQYQQAKQSGEFLIFVMSFVVILLLTAAISISFLGIKSEQEEHGKMIDSLYRIGVTREQIRKDLVFRNRIRYVFPVAIGEIMGMIPVTLWNIAVYQMNFIVVFIEIMIAGFIMLGVWIFSGSIRKE